MEKLSTDTLCKNIDRTCLYHNHTSGTHTNNHILISKVLFLAVYYSNQTSLNAARCNLFNKRWNMQNGMC